VKHTLPNDLLFATYGKTGWRHSLINTYLHDLSLPGLHLILHTGKS
jgi:hypothetical protein